MLLEGRVPMWRTITRLHAQLRNELYLPSLHSLQLFGQECGTASSCVPYLHSSISAQPPIFTWSVKGTLVSTSAIVTAAIISLSKQRQNQAIDSGETLLQQQPSFQQCTSRQDPILDSLKRTRVFKYSKVFHRMLRLPMSICHEGDRSPA